MDSELQSFGICPELIDDLADGLEAYLNKNPKAPDSGRIRETIEELRNKR